MSTPTNVNQQPNTKRGWRYFTGLILFVLHLLLPVLALVFAPMLGLSTGISAILFSLSVAGGPDVLLIAAAALMGKDNLQYLFSKLGSWFKKLVKWDQVSPQRYRIGLWLMCLSVAVPWASSISCRRVCDMVTSLVGAFTSPWAQILSSSSSVGRRRLLGQVGLYASLHRRIKVLGANDVFQVGSTHVLTDVGLHPGKTQLDVGLGQFILQFG
jgi:hypothetical protein